ncbi:MAG: haloalkane dehalogenase, partial [Bacteroidota bacterium]
KMNFKNILWTLTAVLALSFIACNDDDDIILEVCPNCVEGIDTTNIDAGWDYEAKFLTVDGKQLHYIDEAGEGDYTFVFIHGLPTWSYLWRNVMPHLKKRGRIVAIDLIGHGKSDKPNMDYTIGNIADLAVKQLNQLDLGNNIILVVQDWGGPVGFEYARQNPERVKGMVFFETLWAPVPSFDVFPPDFAQFQQFIRTGEEGDNTPGSSWDQMVNQAFILEQLVPDLILRSLSEEEMNQYRAPYANVADRKIMWQLPQEVPIGEDPAEAHVFFEQLQVFMTTTQIPKYMPHGDPGFNVSDADYEFWITLMPNATHETVGSGLHFLQEDEPHKLGIAIRSWVDRL